MATSGTRWATGAGIALLAVGIASPALASGGHSGHHGHGDVEHVEMRDECDPVTFNAALPFEACDPDYDGGVTFDELVEELSDRPGDVLRRRDAKGWKFSRDELKLDEGDRIVAVNTGGETHSFTKVGEYGAGCEPELNAFFVGFRGFPETRTPADLHDLPDFCPAPSGTFAAPGDSVLVEGLERGKHYFECVIHPWMRTTVHVE